MQSLCHIGDIDSGSGKEVCLQGPSGPCYVAVFKVAGEVRAYLNTCPHQGRNLNWGPDEFLIGEDGRLICPHHGACFELQTGRCVEGPCKGDALKPVPVQVEGDIVMLTQALRDG